MVSRIIVHGRTAWASPTFRVPPRTRNPTKASGEPIKDFRIEPNSPDAPFRIGSPYFDPEEQIEYRVVRPEILQPSDGWGTADFWCTRWLATFDFLKKMISKGWVDAAIEAGTRVRRYRCRDEQRVLGELSAPQKIEKRRTKRS